MDSVAILKDAKNVDNAKLFMNFIMAPENAAMISADLLAAPEMTIPEFAVPVAQFQQTCPPEVQELYSRIWTDLTKVTPASFASGSTKAKRYPPTRDVCPDAPADGKAPLCDSHEDPDGNQRPLSA
jgi:spermidine/putrescine-binding protein